MCCSSKFRAECDLRESSPLPERHLMLIEPDELSSNVIAQAVTLNWRINLEHISYAPVGFGSHHWWIQATDGLRWFATVDDLRITSDGSSAMVSRIEPT